MNIRVVITVFTPRRSHSPTSRSPLLLFSLSRLYCCFRIWCWSGWGFSSLKLWTSFWSDLLIWSYEWRSWWSHFRMSWVSWLRCGLPIWTRKQHFSYAWLFSSIFFCWFYLRGWSSRWRWRVSTLRTIHWNSHDCERHQQSCRRHYRQNLRVKKLKELLVLLMLLSLP